MAEPALNPTYPIETERLLLRPIDPEADFEPILAYWSRDDVNAHIPREPATRESLAKVLGDPDRIRSSLTEAGQHMLLAVGRRDTGELIGDAFFSWVSAEHSVGEIGYVVNPDHQGRGFATEMARALLALTFDGLGLRRVVARTGQRNPASHRVLTKLGMRQEAVLVENEWFKGEWSTEVDFAMLEREWRELSR